MSEKFNVTNNLGNTGLKWPSCVKVTLVSITLNVKQTCNSAQWRKRRYKEQQRSSFKEMLFHTLY